MSWIDPGSARFGTVAVSSLTSLYLLASTFVACTRTDSPDTRVADSVSVNGVSDTATASPIPLRPEVATDSTAAHAMIDSAMIAATCSPPVDREWYEPDPDQQLFLKSGMQWGTSEADIVRRLGPPLRIVVDTTRNIHTGEPDELRQVEYPGLEFSIYRALELERDIVYRVDTGSDQYTFAFGFGVGSAWEVVRDCLGEPSGFLEDSTYQYSVGEAEELITFWVAQGIVRSIRWEFYID